MIENKKINKYFVSNILEEFAKNIEEVEKIGNIRYFQTLDSLFSLLSHNFTNKNDFLNYLIELMEKYNIKYLIEKNEYNEVYINFPDDKKNIKKFIEILNHYFL